MKHQIKRYKVFEAQDPIDTISGFLHDIQDLGFVIKFDGNKLEGRSKIRVDLAEFTEAFIELRDRVSDVANIIQYKFENSHSSVPNKVINGHTFGNNSGSSFSIEFDARILTKPEVEIQWSIRNHHAHQFGDRLKFFILSGSTRKGSSSKSAKPAYDKKGMPIKMKMLPVTTLDVGFELFDNDKRDSLQYKFHYVTDDGPPYKLSYKFYHRGSLSGEEFNIDLENAKILKQYLLDTVDDAMKAEIKQVPIEEFIGDYHDENEDEGE